MHTIPGWGKGAWKHVVFRRKKRDIWRHTGLMNYGAACELRNKSLAAGYEAFVMELEVLGEVVKEDDPDAGQ